MSTVNSQEKRNSSRHTIGGKKVFEESFLLTKKVISNLVYRPWRFCDFSRVSSTVRELTVSFTAFIGLFFFTILMILEKYMLKELI